MKTRFLAAAISFILLLASFQPCGSGALALTELHVGSLYPGAYGDDVKALQSMLKEAGLYDDLVDGIYGPATVASVKKLQKYLGVKADGKFGPKTLEAYNSVVTEAKNIQSGLETQFERTGLLSGRIIGIDAGHQEYKDDEHEAIGPESARTKARMSEGSKGVKTGNEEYKITLAVALKLADLLRDSGAEVVMTRVSNHVRLSNRERAQMMNNAGADVWLRLHCDYSNSGRFSGARVVSPSKRSNPGIHYKSKALGEAVLDSFCEATNAKNNSLWYRSDQTGFNWSRVPVITLEMGYLSNIGDDLKLNRDSYQNECARGIFNGIVKFFDDSDQY
ncbi:MAG: Germination-specific N-acetylmuramoyl-L-alanine amidase precursor [Firmicutes bacterium ADurb.Bin182]|nr:MAG: Germination-specific N-acetylmuramoyl-L-alanine amidase precursor [Firmicutes bacterium ADurb.Bin182]